MSGTARRGLEPRATYRLQLRPEFDFDAAAGLAGYLADLGVSHLYASPYLQAAPGSSHGYDIVDHSAVNRELGGEEGHARLLAALEVAELGQVLDIVPNHMAIGGRENAWWWDLLENGPSSRFASYFDISWEPPEPKLRGLVLMPILGDHYGRILENGELRLHREGADFTVLYQEHAFPVAPESLEVLVRGAGLGELAAELASLPRLKPSSRRAAGRRHRVLQELMARLQRAVAKRSVASALDTAVAAVNADPDRLDALLERQHYRLARWQTAGQELDYRRFFDINSLAALRMEDEAVFADTHRRVLDWLSRGVLDGVRVDHPDGLRDPEAYFRRLHEAAPGAWVVAEKILEPGEGLPSTWPVAGTTGYDFMNLAGGLFVDAAGEAPLTGLYASFTGEETDYHEVAYRKKHQAMRESLATDLNRLANLLVRACEANRRYRDFTRRELLEALRESIACLSVYRTYVSPAEGRVSEQDRERVQIAISAAKDNRPDLDPRLFDFLRDLILLRHRGEVEDELVSRYQQTTGPVMAKGVEDTAFYCYNRLVCLNEVGGDPARFGVEVDDFHNACRAAAAAWPRSMLTTTTHDCKRSEDVRARLALLSEIPAAWQDAVLRWTTINDGHRWEEMPDRNAEYLLYQVLVGAHPLGFERAWAYMLKAVREAKVHTSWTAPSEVYEAALRRFVEGALADAEFSGDLAGFTEPLVAPGRVNSLALKLLALTCPGVPDLYQGSELWDLSLVDPDNRRPVDFELRRRLLAELAGLGPEQVLERAEEGLPKLLVVQRALRLRRRRPEVFEGAYKPLDVSGPMAGHLVAFARGGEAVTLVPRLPLGLAGGWQDTSVRLPDGHWRDELTGHECEGGAVEVAELLARFPVALLTK